MDEREAALKAPFAGDPWQNPRSTPASYLALRSDLFRATPVRSTVPSGHSPRGVEANPRGARGGRSPRERGGSEETTCGDHSQSIFTESPSPNVLELIRSPGRAYDESPAEAIKANFSVNGWVR